MLLFLSTLPYKPINNVSYIIENGPGLEVCV